MKKIFSTIIICMAAVAAFVACTPEVEDAFSTTSSQRLEDYNNNVRKVLTSAPNGWRAEYYASRSYGGYNVFMSFTKDSVKIASEKVGNTHGAGVDENGNLIREACHYKLEQSMGSILSIDTYNSVFHYFAEPKNADYGDSGDGMSGDFEFRVLSASPDSVVLEGKKHQSKIRMYPVASDRTWEQEYNDIKKVEKYMSARTYYFFQNGEDKNITITTSYRCLVFNYLNEDSIATSSYVPFVVTKEGYKMYNPVTLLDYKFTGFDLGTEDGIYHASNDNSIYIEAQTLPLVEQLANTAWFITYDNLGAYAQPFWDTFKTALEKAGTNNSKATLYWAIIGDYSGKKGFHMNAGGDQATIGFKFTPVGDTGDVVKLSYNSGDTNKAGTNFYDKFKLKEALTPFIGKTKVTSRTFILSVDNVRRPSYMILTDQNEPTNVIRLEAEEKYYPFGDEPID